MRYLWLGWAIKLRKQYKGIKRITTGIEFNKSKEWYKITADVLDKTGNIIGNDTRYNKKDLILADYAKQVISFWKRRLR